MSSCEKMQLKIMTSKFSGSAGSNVFRLNFCGFGSGAQVYDGRHPEFGFLPYLGRVPSFTEFGDLP